MLTPIILRIILNYKQQFFEFPGGWYCLSEIGVRDTWEKVWREADTIPNWDPLCQTIWENLLIHLSYMPILRILEAGSGTGRVSMRVAKLGHKITLLDTSKTALRMSKELFKSEKMEVDFIQGSAFCLPFVDNSYDIVWNAGVIEHFEKEARHHILSEMARVCRQERFIICMNPYSRAIFYRLGKWAASIARKWKAGNEYPIRSMKKAFERANASTVCEYTVGLTHSFTFFNYFIEYFFPRWLLEKYKIFLQRYMGFGALVDQFKLLIARSRFGRPLGYLLVSVGQKKS